MKSKEKRKKREKQKIYLNLVKKVEKKKGNKVNEEWFKKIKKEWKNYPNLTCIEFMKKKGYIESKYQDLFIDDEDFIESMKEYLKENDKKSK